MQTRKTLAPVSPLRLKEEPLSFRDLMKIRVHEILVVASLYDSFKLEEDGRLTELIFAEYQDMHFTNAPHVNRVASASLALEEIPSGRFDLVITMPRISDMSPFEFGRRVQEIDPNLPVILLVSSAKESNHFVELERSNRGALDKIFYWSGNSSVLPAIIKYSEDKRNAERDILKGLVRAIIVVEDSPQYYSSFLPMIYKIIARHTLRMMKQEYDDDLKLLRVRSRPRILLASSFEEGLAYFEKYQLYILAIISDMEFPVENKLDAMAGIKFLQTIQESENSVPLVLQSKEVKARLLAEAMNVRFFDKNNPNLLEDLRKFVFRHCGFEDLVFEMGEGQEPLVVKDLQSLYNAMDIVPDPAVAYHAQRNHFSNWLAMRGYLEVATRVKAFNDLEQLGNFRSLFKALLKRQRRIKHKNAIVDYFNPDNYDPEINLVRIGGGSLGGKARGIIFVSIFIKRFDLGRRFPNVNINVPSTAMVGTDIFDQFLDVNGIKNQLTPELSSVEINRIFLGGQFDQIFVEHLRVYLSYHQKPVAVRSSSLLEDSDFQPFAGVYKTFMIPCCAADLSKRLDLTLQAIKLVYASVFQKLAQVYLKTTGSHPEDEKMAVMIQDVVGERHGDYFYPTFAGNLQSYNFYPFDHIRRSDGIANVALGLGRTVVNGEKSLRFSPKHPQKLPQYYDKRSIFKNSQSHFYALKLSEEKVQMTGDEADHLALLPLAVAEEQGVLQTVASVYSVASDVFRESLFEEGPRIITFANILKWKIFPLDQILIDMMNFGRRGLGCEVEMEFAANAFLDQTRKQTFSILQIRPLITQNEMPLLEYDSIEEEDLICQSESCLGNGLKTQIKHIIMVKLDEFSSAKTRNIVKEIAYFNASLAAEESYLLIGPGRWGSSDPLLGIPVDWKDISNVGAIIEVGLPHYYVEPSFGSHFFQNLSSLCIAYFSTSPKNYQKNLNLGWLDSIKPQKETKLLKQLSFTEPLTIQINGKNGFGFILKPGLFEKYQYQ